MDTVSYGNHEEEDSTVENYIQTEDANKMILEILGKKYGDYVLHVLECGSKEEAFSSLRRLSFISGETLEELKGPTNVQPIVHVHDRGTWAVVGGQLTSDQNFEVRRTAEEVGVPCDSLCCAHEGSLTQREFLEASKRTKEGTSASGKKWWQVWK